YQNTGSLVHIPPPSTPTRNPHSRGVPAGRSPRRRTQDYTPPKPTQTGGPPTTKPQVKGTTPRFQRRRPPSPLTRGEGGLHKRASETLSSGHALQRGCAYPGAPQANVHATRQRAPASSPPP